MSNPPQPGLATPDTRQRLPTTNHGPAVPTREYQSDRASRTACRTATHPADHTPQTTHANARNHRPPLDNTLSISVENRTTINPPPRRVGGQPPSNRSGLGRASHGPPRPGATQAYSARPPRAPPIERERGCPTRSYVRVRERRRASCGTVGTASHEPNERTATRGRDANADDRGISRVRSLLPRLRSRARSRCPQRRSVQCARGTGLPLRCAGVANTAPACKRSTE